MFAIPRTKRRRRYGHLVAFVKNAHRREERRRERRRTATGEPPCHA